MLRDDNDGDDRATNTPTRSIPAFLMDHFKAV